MRRKLAAVAVFAGLVALFTLFDRFVIHLLGIDTQQSNNYDFVSGAGPMILTALGMSTIITGMWHAMNCHEPGCWRIGRHKVNGTPWCNHHHGNARTEQTLEDRLDRLIDLLTDLLGEPATPQ